MPDYSLNIKIFIEQFDEYVQDVKKTKAIKTLEQMKSLSQTTKAFLDAAKMAMKNRFLKDFEKDFLNRVLKDLHADYLDWCYRTPWVKRQIARYQRKTAKQLVFPIFNFDKTKEVGQVPTELLTKPKSTRHIQKRA